MSAHKQAGVVASVNAGMVVGDGKHRRHYAPHLRLWGIVVFCLIVVVGASYGVYCWRHKDGHTAKNAVASSPKSSQAGPQLPVGFASFTPDQKAEYYIGIKNYTAAQNIYESELQAATMAAGKANVYLELGTDAQNAKNYEQAYRYDVQADTLAPSDLTAQYAAYAAQLAGDNKDAAKYYQLAINRLDKSAQGYGYELGQLQESLKGVSQ